MELKAHAKINLSIDVLSRRADGYHDVRMIMQSVSLYDTLKFNICENGIRLYCNSPDIPCNEKNIVFKMLNLIKEKYDISSGIEVDIEKRIPVAAGLAGGSTDAASAIIAANKIWNLGMSYDEMIALGREIGADVPFCIKGGTALSEGIGEKLTPLPPLPTTLVVLAKPPIQVSTRDVYQKLRLDEIIVRPDTNKIIEYIKEGNIRSIPDNLVNVLESVTIKRYPIIDEIKREMVQAGALGSLMSGSGPTVFGIFDDYIKAETSYNRLRDYIKDVYMVETVNQKGI